MKTLVGAAEPPERLPEYMPMDPVVFAALSAAEVRSGPILGISLAYLAFNAARTAPALHKAQEATRPVRQTWGESAQAPVIRETHAGSKVIQLGPIHEMFDEQDAALQQVDGVSLLVHTRKTPEDIDEIVGANAVVRSIGVCRSVLAIYKHATRPSNTSNYSVDIHVERPKPDIPELGEVVFSLSESFTISELNQPGYGELAVAPTRTTEDIEAIMKQGMRLLLDPLNHIAHETLRQTTQNSAA